MRLLLERIDDSGVQTIGRMFVLDNEDMSEYDCHTLELPWRDNKNSISCIPEGEYQVVKRTSPKFGRHFHILGVPGRSYILIHQGNYHSDIRGCVLVGKDLKDINKDGHIDVVHSKKAMTDLLLLMPDRFTLQVVNPRK